MKKIDYSSVQPAILARELGITRGGISKAVSSGRLVADENGMVNLTAASSYHWLSKRTLRSTERDPGKRKLAERLLRAVDRVRPVDDDDDMPVRPVKEIEGAHGCLRAQAAEAELTAVIRKSALIGEKLIQARLETKQQAEELAPLKYVMFSLTYPDVFITRTFRTIDEIAPAIEASVRAGDTRGAMKAIKARLEAEHDRSKADVIDYIQDGGYHPEPLVEAGKRAAKEILTRKSK